MSVLALLSRFLVGGGGGGCTSEGPFWNPEPSRHDANASKQEAGAQTGNFRQEMVPRGSLRGGGGATREGDLTVGREGHVIM